MAINNEWYIYKTPVLTPETWIHLYSELSEFVLEYSSLDSIYEEDENGDEHMTLEKQNEFCRIVDLVEGIMRNNGLVKEDIWWNS